MVAATVATLAVTGILLLAFTASASTTTIDTVTGLNPYRRSDFGDMRAGALITGDATSTFADNGCRPRLTRMSSEWECLHGGEAVTSNRTR